MRFEPLARFAHLSKQTVEKTALQICRALKKQGASYNRSSHRSRDLRQVACERYVVRTLEQLCAQRPVSSWAPEAYFSV